MDIVFKEEDCEKFYHYLKFYNDNYLSSFHYLDSFIDYSLMYSANLNKDKSFIIVEENKPSSVVFFPIEEVNGGLNVSIADEPCAAPLSISEKKEKKAFGIVDEISQDENIQKVMFASDVLIQEYQNNAFNWLKKYGFIDCSICDTLIDLRKDELQLWKDVRKGHKHDIKKVNKLQNVSVKIVNSSNPNPELHELYRVMHIKCAGRETRDKETFDMQYKMLLEGNASLFVLYYRGSPVSFNYFMHFQKTVQYGSAAQDPDIEGLPIYHLLLWEAIKYFKTGNFEYMRLTEPSGFHKVGGFLDYSTEKQISIGRYKRGFGGEDRTLFRGIKYYNAQAFEHDFREFEKHTLDHIKRS